MNTLQLEKILENYSKDKEFFYGIYPIDRLPNITRFPSCLIVNNQRSNEEGEHWVAIYFDKKGKCEFFDSFAKSPRFYGLQNYLKSYAHRVKYNKQIIQSNYSEYCGLYCIFYLIFKLNHRSMLYYQKLFKKNPNQNDKMFSRWIKKYF